MEAEGFLQAELADAVNDHLAAHGHPATVSDRTIRHWLTGTTHWPHSAQRTALEAVFGCPVTQLGFARHRRNAPAPHEDDPLHRRTLLATATAAATATVAPAVTTPRRIGSSDIERLNARFAQIVAADHRQGGAQAVETQALAMAGQALALQQQGTASERTRKALYACAAAFTSSAMWAAIDGRRFSNAQTHFDRAATLAAMSGDPSIAFRIWSHAGSMYRHLGRPAEGLAANDVARNLRLTRRDPMFAALGHSRHAAILALTGDTAAVQRSLACAQQAFDRADPQAERPLWINSHFDQAELDSLSTTAYLALADYAQAEAHAHRSLAVLRPHLSRSHAITTARLARAQLGQGEIEPALANAATLLEGTAAQHPRIVGMLSDITRTLHTIAPASQTTLDWDARIHDLTPGRTP